MVENRRGTASVVFADMVGYSSLTARNESATHTMWMDFVTTCLQPEAVKHGATVVRMLGDGCLLSFDLPKEALGWCMDVRSTLVSERLTSVPKWPGLSMRFGAHTCEVIHEHDDIYGDGVNTTKRLQERAQADGILLSDALMDALDDKDGLEFRFLGALNYKNLEQAVPTHEVIFQDASLPVRHEGTVLPSIAIMPFRNMTQNEELDYFAEGLIDDMIQSLAGLKELQVIARGSTLPFAKQTVDARDVARILSVRYVLQGAIREAGETIRLTLSFEDALTGDTIFGEKCEFPHRELFAVQDNIVRQIVARVAPNVRAVELEKALRKPPDNFTAYQCMLRALDLMNTLDREDFDKAKEYLDRARVLDPDFVLPVAWAVRWYCVNIGQGWCEDREAAIVQAKELANKAIDIDRHNPLALAAYGHVKSYLEKDFSTALVYFDRARQIGPSHAMTWILSSGTLSYLDKGEEALEHARRGLDLSPNDQDLFLFYCFLSVAHMACDEFDEALTWAKLSHSENGNYSANLKQLVTLNCALGNMSEARNFAGQLLKAEPAFRIEKYRKVCPLISKVKRERYLNFLEQAGLPG